MLAVTRFLEAFPGAYFGPWEETQDGRIPWPTFWVMYREIPTIKAQNRYHMMLAVGQGASSFLDAKVYREILKDEFEEGFPDG